MKYRKKPVEIEAVRITAADYNPAALPHWDGSPFSELPDWITAAFKDGVLVPHNTGCTDYAQWKVKTLEGEMSANPGDYIIRGIKGELYPCKPDIFEATYDPVSGRE